jgi:hypothetical protein
LLLCRLSVFTGGLPYGKAGINQEAAGRKQLGAKAIELDLVNPFWFGPGGGVRAALACSGGTKRRRIRRQAPAGAGFPKKSGTEHVTPPALLISIGKNATLGKRFFPVRSAGWRRGAYSCGCCPAFSAGRPAFAFRDCHCLVVPCYPPVVAARKLRKFRAVAGHWALRFEAPQDKR